MGVSIQDRTDFLNMLDACRTEQQLFSRLTFAVMFHQTDPAAREDLLDDVRGAACNMQLPAVNYKIDQWLNTCKQAWQADPAAFMAAVNADAKQRKLALEGSAAQPGLLADVPMQSVAWLVPQLLPLGEVSLLGADGGTGKGIWQAQLIAYVTAGRTSGFFPQPPEKTGSVLLADDFSHLFYTDFQSLLSHLDLDDIARLDIIRCTGDLVVYENLSGIACFVGNGTPFDESGDLQIFIQPHGSLPPLNFVWFSSRGRSTRRGRGFPFPAFPRCSFPPWHGNSQ